MGIAAASNRHGSAFAAFVFAWAAGAAPSRAAECGGSCVRVKVVEARISNASLRVTLTGDIEAKFQSNIAFRINGKIASRLVDVGQHVTRDQVLARLEPQDQKANLDTALAALASANALLAQARVNFERQQTLFRQGFTTRPSFDQAQQTLRTQEAAVTSAEATVGNAREQLAYTSLVAGSDGIVVARNAEVGQVVQAGTTVFAVAQDGPRDAVFDVYEALLSKPPADQDVTVVLGSDPTVKTTGRVREISPSVDATSGAVKVKVELASTPERMALGATVIGSAAVASERAIVLPASALFYWDRRPAVWVVDAASTVKPLVIGIGRYDGSDFSVRSGIAPGMRVVSAGIQFLRPGQTVEIAAGGPGS